MSAKNDKLEYPENWENAQSSSDPQFIDGIIVRETEYRNPLGDQLVGAVTGNARRIQSSPLMSYPNFIPSITVYRVRGIDNAQNSGTVFHTSRVIFTSVGERRAEAVSVMKTFSPFLSQGDTYIQFYGEQPSIFAFSGTLFNAKTPFLQGVIQNGDVSPDARPDSDWYNSFLYAYERILRGSKSAELGLKTRVAYSNQWRDGYMLDFTTMHNSEAMNEVQFSFNLVVLDSGVYFNTDAEIVSAPFVDNAVTSVQQPPYGSSPVIHDGNILPQ